jgi:DNA-binding beta-propeller fold protein YncE
MPEGQGMRRTSFLLLLTLCSMWLPAAASASGIAFIVNSAGASISVVDMTTLKEVRRIPALREPHHVALSPDGKSLLVGDTAGNEMLFLDPATGVVQKRVPVADPYQLGFSPDGRMLVVNGLLRNQVDVYDAETMKLIKRFPVVATPSHLAFKPDSSVVYVSLQDSNRLIALDLRNMSVLWDEPVGKTPAGVLWHDGKVLVADMGTDHLAEVDPQDGKVLANIPTGMGAHNIFLSPDHKIIWVNNRVGGTTVSLDAKTLKQIRAYKIPGGPDDTDFAPDGRLWITRRWAEKVAVLDPATGDYDTVYVGRSPHGLFLNPRAPTPTPVASR